MRLEWANTQSKGKGFVPTYVCVCVAGEMSNLASIFPPPWECAVSVARHELRFRTGRALSNHTHHPG